MGRKQKSRREPGHLKLGMMRGIQQLWLAGNFKSKIFMKKRMAIDIPIRNSAGKEESLLATLDTGEYMNLI